MIGLPFGGSKRHEFRLVGIGFLRGGGIFTAYIGLFDPDGGFFVSSTQKRGNRFPASPCEHH
jgi:hypothetical protein